MAHELILGGQRSGKSRCAEARAAAWLTQPGHRARLLATALAGDEEMAARIARHRRDRAERLPAMALLEVPRDLGQALREYSAPDELLVVDCLTLWLTNLSMPGNGRPLDEEVVAARCDGLCQALREASGPVVLVSNEIGMGLVPISAAARRFVDQLSRLHQALAAQCADVTWMVAGLEVAVKRGSR